MSETTKLGVSIEAEGASAAEAQIKGLQASIKALQDEISRASAAGVDGGGNYVKILQKEIDTINAQIAALRAQAAAINEVTSSITRQGAAAAAANRLSSSSGDGSATMMREMRHMVAGFDELSRGQRGALFSTMGAAARDAGIGIGGMAASIGGLVAIMGAGALLRGAQEMGEWATKTRAAASAAGMSLPSYSALQGALSLVGVKADSADAALRHIAESLSAALADPASKTAEAFHNLGISQDELTKTGGDTGAALKLLADAFVKTADGANKTAAMAQIAGRGFESIIPALQGGSQELQTLEDKARSLGLTLTEDTADKLSKTGEAVKSLADTIRGHGIKAFEDWAPVIKVVADNLQIVIDKALEAVGAIGRFVSAEMVLQQAQGETASRSAPYSSWSDFFTRFGDISGGGVGKGPSKGAPFLGPSILPSGNYGSGINYQPKTEVPPLTKPDREASAETLMRQQMTAAALAASKGGDRQAEMKAEIAVMQQTLATAKLTAEQRAAITSELQQKEIQLNNSAASAGEKAFKQSYEDFAANERLKVSEAQGNSAQIIAIYNEWEKAATGTYKQAALVAIEIEKEKVQAINTARLNEIKEGAKLEEQLNRSSLVMGQASAIGAGTARYPGQLSVGGQGNVGQNTAALAAQAQAIEASAQQEVAALTEVMNTAAKGSDTQKAAAQEILSVVTEAKSQEVALYNKAAEASIAAANKSKENFNKFFDSLGTQFESFTNSLLKALIAPQQELIKQGLTTIKRSEGQNEIKQAIAKMLLSGVDDAVKGVESAVSQTLASMLSNALQIPMQAGGGLSSLFSSGLSKLFGGSVGGLPSAAQFGLAATSLTTAGTTLNTAAITLGTAATALSTAAATAATASAAGGVTDAGGFLGLASLFAFSGGGIVPSAAGGMVNGMGATLAMLHAKEMVLPAHLSEGIQSMINGDRGVSTNSANLNYSPTINTASRSRGGTGMTRTEFGAMMASHSGAMMGEARNMMRNGWRPGG